MTKDQRAALHDMEMLRKQLATAYSRAAPRPKKYAKGRERLVRDGELNVDALRLWMHEMVEWGQRVRVDILRLEQCCCLSAGDPGDPPREPQ